MRISLTVLTVTSMLGVSALASANGIKDEFRTLDFEKVCNGPASITVNSSTVSVECFTSALENLNNKTSTGNYLKAFVPKNVITPNDLLKSVKGLPRTVRTFEALDKNDKVIGYETEYTYANESNTRLVASFKLVYDLNGEIAYMNFHEFKADK